MKHIKKSNGAKRKRTLSTNSVTVSLDDALRDVFNHIDEHCQSSPKASKNKLNKVATVTTVPTASAQVTEHSDQESVSEIYPIPESSYIKSDSDSSVEPDTSTNHDRNQVNGSRKGQKAEENRSYITINKTSLKHAFDLLSENTKLEKKKDKAYKFRRTCQEGYDHMLDMVNWQSYSFVVRAIRNLILERDWMHLRELLLLMLKQHKMLKNYIKEITYLYFMINADCIDPMQVEEYFLFCFSSYDKNKKPLREFDIWFKNYEY